MRAIVTPNAKHLDNICTMVDQRGRRWAVAVQIVYKWFVSSETS